MQAVFEEPIEFRIEFDQKRGKTEARLAFVQGNVEMNPRDAEAGGVVDVAAFALRLACLVLTKPPLRRLLILDEPFRFVSVEYRDRVRELLEKLAEEMGVQIILVTHMPELEAGKVIRLK